MAVYESFENNDRTMTMNLDEDTDKDKGGENARRFRYSRFYLFFCGTRNLSRKEEIMLMKILPLSILAIIILISFIAVLTQGVPPSTEQTTIVTTTATTSTTTTSTTISSTTTTTSTTTTKSSTTTTSTTTTSSTTTTTTTLTSAGLWVWAHPGNSPEKTKFEFKIECERKCRNITITENTHNGDVDLYAAEDKKPEISTVDHRCFHCNCVSRNTNDKCYVPQPKGTLYFTAYVYQTHTNLTVTVTGDNISNIYCVGECGGSNGTLSTLV